MLYVSEYNSILGDMLMASDGNSLIGLWFKRQKYFASTLNEEFEKKELEIFKETKKWLDIYFSGVKPDFDLSISFIGTPFQKSVWKILVDIPYGKTITYGEISKILAKKRNIKSMSSQAVGNAVGHNPISIIVPCHRVIGSNVELTGYAGGIDKKRKLLKLEGINI